MRNLAKQSGVTLMELLIVVAIMGILASVAYPSYVDHVVRSNRAEAQRELSRLASLQEQYYTDHRTYTTDMKSLGASASPYITESGNYSIAGVIGSSGGVAGVTFKLTATAKGTQATEDSSCLTLSIDETGQQTATSTTCWEK